MIQIDFSVGGEPPVIRAGTLSGGIRQSKWEAVYNLIDSLAIDGPWASFILPNKKVGLSCQTSCHNYCYIGKHEKNRRITGKLKGFRVNTVMEVQKDDTVKFWIRKVSVEKDNEPG